MNATTITDDLVAAFPRCASTTPVARAIPLPRHHRLEVAEVTFAQAVQFSGFDDPLARRPLDDLFRVDVERQVVGSENRTAERRRDWEREFLQEADALSFCFRVGIENSKEEAERLRAKLKDAEESLSTVSLLSVYIWSLWADWAPNP
jgi:antitoxin (DNA-binding transcriptional repressor) of toxin-antitoxin stability system